MLVNCFPRFLVCSKCRCDLERTRAIGTERMRGLLTSRAGGSSGTRRSVRRGGSATGSDNVELLGLGENAVEAQGVLADEVDLEALAVGDGDRATLQGVGLSGRRDTISDVDGGGWVDSEVDNLDGEGSRIRGNGLPLDLDVLGEVNVGGVGGSCDPEGSSGGHEGGNDGDLEEHGDAWELDLVFGKMGVV